MALPNLDLAWAFPILGVTITPVLIAPKANAYNPLLGSTIALTDSHNDLPTI